MVKCGPDLVFIVMLITLIPMAGGMACLGERRVWENENGSDSSYHNNEIFCQ